MASFSASVAAAIGGAVATDVGDAQGASLCSPSFHGLFHFVKPTIVQAGATCLSDFADSLGELLSCDPVLRGTEQRRAGHD